MIAVSGGWVGKACFFEMVPRSLFKLMSFLGFEMSFCDSYSWMSAFAISEQARIYRSFSGTCFAFFLATFLEGGIVTVMVAMVNGSPRNGKRGSENTGD